MENIKKIKLKDEESWQSDDKAKTCFRCNSTFYFLIKRKHHCRYCGNIFCQDCSGFFIQGKYFETNEKKVRLCQQCYTKCEQFLNKQGVYIEGKKPDNLLILNKNNSQQLEKNKIQNNYKQSQSDFRGGNNEETDNNNSQSGENSEDLEPQQITNTIQKYEEDRTQLIELEQIVLKKIKKLSEYTVMKNNSDPKWAGIIYDFVTKAIQDIKIETFFSKDSQDICSYVKIKKILNRSIQQDHNKYIKGIICRKNVSNKKMKTAFENPKILIINSSIQFQSMDFENLVKNEKKYMKKIVDKILKLEPDIVFVENTIHRLAQEQLHKEQITVVYHIKPRILKKIAKATHAKQISDIEKIDSYSKEKTLGTCKTLKFITYGENSFKKNKDPTLMFLECDNSLGGVSMCISGDSLQELKYMKKLIRDLLKISRHMWLEKNMIHLNNELVKQLNHKKQIKQDNKQVEDDQYTYGNFSNFIDEYLSLEKFLKTDQVFYTKIYFMEANLQNFNDIKDENELKEYIKSRKEHFNSSKVDYFSEICDFKDKTIDFGSKKEDISLGQQILEIIKTRNTKCEHCKRPRYTHTAVYYHGNTFVKMNTDQDISGQEDRQIDNFNQNQRIQQQQQLLHTRSQKFQEINRNPIQENIQQPRLLQKKKIEISTYIECENCKEILTNVPILLKKQHLDYSFGRFLHHLFLTFNKHPFQEFKPYKQQGQMCTHFHKCRVFKYEHTMVKFIVKKYEYFNLLKFDIFSLPVKQKVIQLDKQNFQESRYRFKKNYKQIISLFVRIVKKNQDRLKAKNITNDIELLNKDKELKDLELNLDESFQINLKLLEQVYNIVDLCILIQYIFINLNSYWESYKKNLEKIKQKKTRNDTLMGLNKLLGSQQVSQADQKLKRQSTISNLTQNSVQRNTLQKRNTVLINKQQSDQLKAISILEEDEDTIIMDNISNNNQNNQDSNNQQSQQQSKTNKFNIRDLEKKILELNNGNLEPEQSQDKNKKFEYIPVYENQIMSYIAWSLNSSPYLNEIYYKQNFNKYEYIFLDEQQRQQGIVDLRGIPNQYFKEDQQFEEFMKEKLTSEKIYEATQTQNNPNLQNDPNQNQSNNQNYQSVYENNNQYVSAPSQQYQLFNHKIVLPIYKQKQNYCISQTHFIQEQLEKIRQTSAEISISPKKKSSQQVEKVLEIQQLQKEIQNMEGNHNNEHEIKLTNQISSVSTNDQQSIQNSILQPQLSQNKQQSQQKFGEVSIYFPEKFEALRMCNNISLNRYIISTLSSADFQTEGGKQNADFFKSGDDLIVVKCVNESEFKHFKTFASDYFSHCQKNRYGKKPSLLAKIYGMYEVRTYFKEIKYVIVMENLFFGIPTDQDFISVYDLKGSESNRFIKQSSGTLLDTNFKIDRNAEPLPIIQESYQTIDRALHNDSKFLFNHSVVDYSLLLIINKKDNYIKMGIIDYLREYDMASQLEYKYKVIKNWGGIPTIVPPEMYKNRFLEYFTKKYIVKVEVSQNQDNSAFSLKSNTNEQKIDEQIKSLTEMIQKNEESKKQDEQTQNQKQEIEQRKQQLIEDSKMLNQKFKEKENIINQKQQLQIQKEKEIQSQENKKEDQILEIQTEEIKIEKSSKDILTNSDLNIQNGYNISESQNQQQEINDQQQNMHLQQENDTQNQNNLIQIDYENDDNTQNQDNNQINLNQQESDINKQNSIVQQQVNSNIEQQQNYKIDIQSNKIEDLQQKELMDSKEAQHNNEQINQQNLQTNIQETLNEMEKQQENKQQQTIVEVQEIEEEKCNRQSQENFVSDQISQNSQLNEKICQEICQEQQKNIIETDLNNIQKNAELNIQKEEYDENNISNNKQ